MLVIGLALRICIVIFDLPAAQPQIGGNDPNKILKLVHTLIRHGNMTPSEVYPKDPYINDFYPNRLGMLINAGKHLLFEDGKWLRQQYDNYLGKYYCPDELWAQAIDVPLTIMSMATTLAGLFSPVDTPLQWNEKLNWQPIPIFAKPIETETILLIPTPCPRYNEAFAEVYKPFLAANQHIINELANLTGWSLQINQYICRLYNTLLSEENCGLKLPDWTKKYYPDKLKSFAESCYIHNSYTDEMKRISGGPFIQQMINDWTQKINGTITLANRKMFMYVTHGANFVNVLNTLNVWKKQMPDYGIMAIFELLQDKNTGVYGVQVYTKTNAQSDATSLTIPGCDNFCPLETFLQITKNFIPTNLTLECELKPQNSSSS